MKKIIYCLFIIVPLCGHAQKQNNIWCFGFNAGLDFNSGKPVPITTDSIFTNEGCASIADKNTGRLLFYTDGVSVWDSANDIMPNGIGLGGNLSSTQSALIVPEPGSNTLFYIFTVDEQAGLYGGGSGGLNYNVVDMTLNSGLGDVTILDSLLLTPTTEKLCATYAANGTDIWVMVHLWNSDAFYAYLVTANGISVPIITHSGIVHRDVGSGENAESIGYMKFSPNGKKLAVVCYVDLNLVQVFDFDNATGIVSNPFMDNNYPNYTGIDGPYGMSFSPDNSKLYVSCPSDLNSPKIIYQYDMMAGDSTAIVSSRNAVATYYNYFIGTLQNGPDGKMYIPIGWDTLDVIANPNGYGSQCDYRYRALYLGGENFEGKLGLPNMIERPLTNTGVQNIDVSATIALYPNPAGEQLTIALGEAGSSGQLAMSSLQIINMLGQTIITKLPNANDKQTVIDVSALPAGIYLLQVKTGEGVMVKKFVKS